MLTRLILNTAKFFISSERYCDQLGSKGFFYLRHCLAFLREKAIAFEKDDCHSRVANNLRTFVRDVSNVNAVGSLELFHQSTSAASACFPW
jgi:hypothetical protein